MRRVVAAIACRDGKVLIARRKVGDEMGGLWEFPGGTVEEGESDEECLRREIEEELGVTPQVSEFLGEFQLTQGEISLSVYLVELPEDKFVFREHDEFRWVDVKELSGYEMPDVDREVVRALFSDSKLFNTLPK